MAVILKNRGDLTLERKAKLYLNYLQHWQALEPKDLNNLDAAPPIAQQEIIAPPASQAVNVNEINKKVIKAKKLKKESKAPSGGWATNKSGSKSGAQMSKGDLEKYSECMDVRIKRREAAPAFSSDGFFGID